MVFVHKYFVIFSVVRNYNVSYVVGKILLAGFVGIFVWIRSHSFHARAICHDYVTTVLYIRFVLFVSSSHKMDYRKIGEIFIKGATILHQTVNIWEPRSTALYITEYEL